MTAFNLAVLSTAIFTLHTYIMLEKLECSTNVYFNSLEHAKGAGAKSNNGALFNHINKNLALDPDLAMMMNLYRQQAVNRRKYMRCAREELGDYQEFYSNLVPEAYCPILVRVGTTDDGGKWICNPFRIPRDSIVLSFGIGQEVTFEAELQKITRSCCSIFGYDIRGDRRKVKFLYSQIPRTHLRKAYVGSFDWKDTYTVETLLNLDNITAVEIMKMDIESSEYKVLPQFLITYRPAQIMVEIHGISMLTATLLQGISLHGYWLISYEINGGFYESCEYSFIHESAFTKYHAIPLAKYLD